MQRRLFQAFFLRLDRTELMVILSPRAPAWVITKGKWSQAVGFYLINILGTHSPLVEWEFLLFSNDISDMSHLSCLSAGHWGWGGSLGAAQSPVSGSLRDPALGWSSSQGDFPGCFWAVTGWGQVISATSGLLTAWPKQGLEHPGPPGCSPRPEFCPVGRPALFLALPTGSLPLLPSQRLGLPLPSFLPFL